MSKGLEALKHLYAKLSAKSSIDDISENLKEYDIIEKELKVLEYLKEICLEGKDKYGKVTWGWVEFDLDDHPKLKEWLKDD